VKNLQKNLFIMGFGKTWSIIDEREEKTSAFVIKLYWAGNTTHRTLAYA
jgi:hypothetical protein